MRQKGMTVRKWVLAVAAAAPILAVTVGIQRRARYLEKYRSYKLPEILSGIRRDEKIDGVSWLARFYFDADGNLKREYLNRFKTQQAYYSGLRRKYRYAADHPWIYVEPDPPSPYTYVEPDGPTTEAKIGN
jgi:hypothetical protein